MRLLLRLISTNSPPAPGGENFPKSTCPAGRFSAQTLILAMAERITTPRATGINRFILGSKVSGCWFGNHGPVRANTRDPREKFQKNAERRIMAWALLGSDVRFRDFF